MQRKEDSSSLDGFKDLKEIRSLIRLRIEDGKKQILETPLHFYWYLRRTYHLKCTSLRANDSWITVK